MVLVVFQFSFILFIVFVVVISCNKGLPSTKLHVLHLDHQNVKLTWFIDWPKREVLFNVDEAFIDDTEWFSFGFSKRGKVEGSDVCFFVRSIFDESYNEAIVSLSFVYLPAATKSDCFLFLGYIHWQ